MPGALEIPPEPRPGGRAPPGVLAPLRWELPPHSLLADDPDRGLSWAADLKLKFLSSRLANTLSK